MERGPVRTERLIKLCLLLDSSRQVRSTSSQTIPGSQRHSQRSSCHQTASTNRALYLGLEISGPQSKGLQDRTRSFSLRIHNDVIYRQPTISPDSLLLFLFFFLAEDLLARAVSAALTIVHTTATCILTFDSGGKRGWCAKRAHYATGFPYGCLLFTYSNVQGEGYGSKTDDVLRVMEIGARHEAPPCEVILSFLLMHPARRTRLERSRTWR